ncbi:MAG: beta-N-acetylhexosaminidase [Chitinophagaceae bacterium]|nr:MAG: beta-N-acetylhexosaminidase [Chitinophagaceae bacterium]
MKKILTACLLLCSLHVFSQTGNPVAGQLLPAVVSLKTTGTGYFTIPANAVIRASGGEEVIAVAKLFSLALNHSATYKTTVTGGTASSGIRFVIDKSGSDVKGAYKLSVSATGIVVSAKEPAGLFYGLQTLLQLLPPAIETTGRTSTTWKLSRVEITDAPRFAWRGLMLDVARHFFTVAEVKLFIDQMAKYKFNVLHWHLADDQGWRIEIKSLPRLTEIGAWRPEKTGTFGDMSVPSPDEPKTYGGFYTHEQIRDVVAYARTRFVDIVPEIDVPGHSMAALAAFPNLACIPGVKAPSAGDKFMEWPASGHFYGLVDNSLCPANEEVYVFLDKVFTEVAQLFPFEYIHMGGDETARNFWEKSDAIKALMQKENLKNLDEVQAYFVKRVAKIIAAKGKKMIGWDEIMDGGLAENAAVMSWRGLKKGADAAKDKHYVVMTPTDFVYLDYMQSDVSMEPPVYASLRLHKTYQFEPMPEGVEAKYILGGQGNLWTEQVYNFRQVQYMVWPRSFAIAEVLWSPAAPRNWNGFVKRVETQFVRLDSAQVKYSPAIYDADIIVKGDSNQLLLDFKPEIEDLNLHYSFDNSYPDQFYPVYKETLKVPRDASLLRVISYRGKKPIGRMMSVPVKDLKKRL